MEQSNAAASTQRNGELMRAQVLLQPGELQLLVRPRPGPGVVVVRVKAAPTCGTDLKAFLRFPLEQAADAHRTAAQDRSAIKTLLTFPSAVGS